MFKILGKVIHMGLTSIYSNIFSQKLVIVHNNSLPCLVAHEKWFHLKLALAVLCPLRSKWELHSTLNVHTIEHRSIFVMLMQKKASLC